MYLVRPLLPSSESATATERLHHEAFEQPILIDVDGPPNAAVEHPLRPSMPVDVARARERLHEASDRDAARELPSHPEILPGKHVMRVRGDLWEQPKEAWFPQRPVDSSTHTQQFLLDGVFRRRPDVEPDETTRLLHAEGDRRRQTLLEIVDEGSEPVVAKLRGAHGDDPRLRLGR